MERPVVHDGRQTRRLGIQPLVFRLIFWEVVAAAVLEGTLGRVFIPLRHGGERDAGLGKVKQAMFRWKAPFPLCLQHDVVDS